MPYSRPQQLPHPCGLAGEVVALRHAGRCTFNRLNSAMAEPVTLRSHDEVAALLGGLDLVEPGVVQAAQWRPDRGTAVPESQMWCGVGRKA